MNTTYYKYATYFLAINDAGDFISIDPNSDTKLMTIGNDKDLQKATYEQAANGEIDQISFEHFKSAYNLYNAHTQSAINKLV